MDVWRGWPGWLAQCALCRNNIRSRKALPVSQGRGLLDPPWPSSTMFNETVEDTLVEAETLERHVKTVTMRVESMATTDADFFKTLVSRQEEAHLNALSHLSTVAPAAKHQKPPEFHWRTAPEMSFSWHSTPIRTIQPKVVIFSSSQRRCGRHSGPTCAFTKILQMLVTAQAWNVASQYGPASCSSF